MELQVLSELANNHVVEVNKSLKDLENIDSRIKGIGVNTTVALYTDNGSSGGTTRISDILSPELFAELETKVISAMERERYERENHLLDLIQHQRKAAIPSPVFVEAVRDMEVNRRVEDTDKKTERKTTKRKTIELDIDVVKDLYVNKGYTYKKVSEHCGCAEGTIYNFIKKHGITREEAKPVEAIKDTYPKMTVEEVRKIYTNGSLSLADSAKYFGVKSGVLYNFVEKHCLRKPLIKKNDPFRDKEKMGKEEFTKKMLATRK